jgi:uncharacterized RDD family membrane protein YckC
MNMKNDVADAPVVRRLAAFAIDAAITLGLSVAVLSAWVIHVVGRVPVSEIEWQRAVSGLEDLTLAQYLPVLAYVFWSWTPLSGRRSLGKRVLGLRVIHDWTHKSPPTEGGLMRDGRW